MIVIYHSNNCVQLSALQAPVPLSPLSPPSPLSPVYVSSESDCDEGTITSEVSESFLKRGEIITVNASL